MALNINLLSHSSGGQQFSKARYGQGYAPSETCREESFLASSNFWSSLAFLGLYIHHSSLCLLCHMALFLRVTVSSLLIKIEAVLD